MSKKVTLEKFSGLEWLTVTGVPAKDTKFGFGVDASVLKRIEELVATHIVAERVPIRGAEVAFLRKTFGYSLGRLGAELGFSSAGILKWERADRKRLDRVNEIAMRTWAAEKLGLKIPALFSKLLGLQDIPEKIALKAS